MFYNGLITQKGANIMALYGEEMIEEEAIEEINNTIKKAFPRDSVLDVTVTEEGVLLFFEVILERPVDDVIDNYRAIALESLQQINYTLDDITDYLKENGFINGEFKDIRSYVEKIDFSEVMRTYKIERSIIEKIKKAIEEKAEVAFTVYNVSKKVYAESEKIINECLEKTNNTFSLEDIAKNDRLGFVLNSVDFNKNTIGVYNLNNLSDVTKMLDSIGEKDILAKTLVNTEYKQLAINFMQKLKRNDFEDLISLVKTFDTTFYEVITGNQKFIDDYLNNTLTEYGYYKYKNFYVIGSY